jgi:uncharacterized protein (DUF2267 family)
MSDNTKGGTAMSLATHAPFDSTYRTTSAWLRELMHELGWDDPRRAYAALRAVLHALRDRLTVAEAADLAAQLPMLIRGLFFEGWRPNEVPVKGRRREDFLAHVAAAFRDDPGVYPEAVAGAVFQVLRRHVSAGEVGAVKGLLPAEIRSLWPEGEVNRRG